MTSIISNSASSSWLFHISGELVRRGVMSTVIITMIVTLLSMLESMNLSWVNKTF
jgi:hypothetical protein